MNIKLWLHDLDRDRALLVLLSFFTLASAIVRLYGIGQRHIVYDEGVHAYWSWKLLTEGTYTYHGQFHGPILYYISALTFKFTNASVTVGRIIIAVSTLPMIFGLHLFKDTFPRPGLAFAGGVLALHPLVLRTARFYRNDLLTLTFLVLALGVFSSYRVQPTRRRAIIIGVLVSGMIATKEISYLLILFLLAPIALFTYAETRFTDRSFTDALDHYLPQRHLTALLVSATVGVLVLYSGWPPRPHLAPVYLLDGIQTWVSRGSGTVRPLYYITLFASEAPLILALAAVGCLYTFLQPRATFDRWLIIAWLGLTSVILSLYTHQNWHLQLFIFTPMVILAGVGLTETVSYTLRWASSRDTDLVTTATPVLINGIAVCLILLLQVVAPAYALPGLTTDARPDYTDSMAEYATDQAAETGCPLYLGTDQPWLWPDRWHLRHYQGDVAWVSGWPPSVVWKDGGFTTGHTQASTPAVVAKKQPIPALENNSSMQVARFGWWRVYTPKNGYHCG